MDLPRQFGAYELLEQLGSGGMGDVFLARSRERGRGHPPLVVIKRMHSELGATSRGVQRFQHEAKIASLIDSPYVARVFDAGSVGDDLYITMEHIVGWPLSRILLALADRGEAMPISAAIELIHGIALGLQAIHEAKGDSGQDLQAVHRDIAPKNLMLGEDGRPRVIDLGIGKSRLQEWKTKTGAVLGSPGYLAPEQVLTGATDQRTDLYALGIVAWELVSGQPFIPVSSVPVMLHAALSPAHRPLVELRSDVPPALDAIVERLLAHEPSARVQSARALVAALEELLPPRGGALRDLVDETLLSELEGTKTRVAYWLTSTLGDERLSPHDLLASSTGAAQRPLPAVYPPATTPRSQPAAVARPQSSKPLLASAAIALLVCVAVALAASLRGPEVRPRTLPIPAPAVVVTATRAVVAHPRPSVLEPAALKRVEPPAPVEPALGRKARKELPKQPRPSAPPPSPSAPADPAEPALPVEVGSVDLLKRDALAAYARAMGLRSRVEASDPRRERVDRVVAALMLQKSAPDRAKLEELKRELAALER